MVAIAGKNLAPQRLTLGSQPATLLIGQKQALPGGLELLFEDPVFSTR